ATPELPLTSKPLPAVAKTAPRGEVVLKKSAGSAFGAALLSGTPSQLISRRPEPTEPAVFALSVPRLVRKESTVDWMAAALAPVASRKEKVVGTTRSSSLSTAGRKRRYG